MEFFMGMFIGIIIAFPLGCICMSEGKTEV